MSEPTIRELWPLPQVDELAVVCDRFANDPPTRYPRVRGRCPSCRSESLFLGENGYVTCGVIGCKDPGAAYDWLAADPKPTPPGLQDTPGDQMAPADDKIEELLRPLDVLYKYASDDGCPNTECHRFSRPNKARLVVETWLEDLGRDVEG